MKKHNGLLLFSIFYFHFNFFNFAQNIWPNEISIGLLNNNLEKEFYYLAANETLVDLKNNGIIPNNVYFKIFQRWACDELSAVNNSIQLWTQHNVSIIFGPECSQGMAAMGVVAASYNKPVIGYQSVSADLGNSTRYSTLIRTSNVMGYMASAIASILTYYNWTKVSIVQNAANCSMQLSGIDDEFRNRNITIVNNIFVDFTSQDSINNALLILKLTSRIILLCNGNTPNTVLNFLTTADKSGMNTADYVYITPTFMTENYSPWEPWLQTNTVLANSSARTAYKNAIVVQTKGQSGNLFNRFWTRLANIVDENPEKYPTKFLLDYMIYLGVLRDSIYLYGAILNKSITYGIDVTNGIEFFKATVNTVLPKGITGKIVIDDTGKRIPSYYVWKMNSSGEFSPFMSIADLNESDFSYMLDVNSVFNEPVWNTFDGFPPPMVPECGFQEEFCKESYTLDYIFYKHSRNYSESEFFHKSSPLYILTDGVISKLDWTPGAFFYANELAIAIPIGVISFLCLVVCGIYLYRKYDFEQQLREMSWRIDLSQFHCNARQPVQEAFSGGSAQVEADQVTNFSGSQGTGSSGEKYTGTGNYKGNTVAVKKWHRVAKFPMNRDILLRLKTIKDMNHDNINKFIGFSTDVEGAVICLWNYCAKRSLQDVIYNLDIHLDTTFQGSILRDIVSGLEYLHMSLIGYHGRLFVSNCVVDSRWIVKLTDFGLQPIIAHMKQERIIVDGEELDMNKMLCTAPEVLRCPLLTDLKPADIYQFGMIMYQILFREPPFADSHLTTQEIIISLKRETANSVVLRPVLKHVEGFGIGLQGLIVNCWRENMDSRPTVTDLKKEIFSSTTKFGKNLMDHVMSMLERYATNLEKIVDERTVQLNEERNRADRLLYQLLPKTVADALKTGHTVPPETFDCVTIYFSDIVGFTTLCSKSKPMEIVSMLNTLYSQFDALIIKCDAFKVETIGDAYLVVSGLPVRNGTKHVSVIADLALEISKALNLFTIPHLPNVSLKLRIGIHSGPVAAGVVGLTMPKYCLFGDTVNFASRMESTGEAGKIHITEFTKRMLDKYSEYVTDLRGDIHVKGKGLCTTYWLLDKLK